MSNANYESSRTAFRSEQPKPAPRTGRPVEDVHEDFAAHQERVAQAELAYLQASFAHEDAIADHLAQVTRVATAAVAAARLFAMRIDSGLLIGGGPKATQLADEVSAQLSALQATEEALRTKRKAVNTARSVELRAFEAKHAALRAELVEA